LIETPKLRSLLTEAIRYWELRRLIYNLLLLIILLYYVGKADGWPLFSSSEFLAVCAIYAVFANVAYSLAYIPDLVIRYSLLPARVKNIGLTIIFLLGLSVAFIISRYVCDELVRSYAWLKSS